MKYAKVLSRIGDRVRQIKKFNSECEEWGLRAMNTWLMEGCPDGADDEEIRDYVSENETYEEWIRVYNCIVDFVNEYGEVD